MIGITNSQGELFKDYNDYLLECKDHLRKCHFNKY